MDFTEIIKAMETMTDAQIVSIQKSADGIMKIRENEKRAKAIQNFKEAFSTLCETGVFVSIGEDYDCIRIEDVDEFNFF